MESWSNDNTTIAFDKNVKIDETTISAGKYGFFIIPKENGDWLLILSKKIMPRKLFLTTKIEYSTFKYYPKICRGKSRNVNL